MDTLILVIAGIFTVVMFIMLPKYARFINTQPKEHMKRMQEQEEAKKSAKSGEEKNQD